MKIQLVLPLDIAGLHHALVKTCKNELSLTKMNCYVLFFSGSGTSKITMRIPMLAQCAASVMVSDKCAIN